MTVPGGSNYFDVPVPLPVEEPAPVPPVAEPVESEDVPVVPDELPEVLPDELPDESLGDAPELGLADDGDVVLLGLLEGMLELEP